MLYVPCLLYTSLDLCLVDLYSGVAEAMKLGAVASFIMGRDGVEVLESEHVPDVYKRQMVRRLGGIFCVKKAGGT